MSLKKLFAVVIAAVMCVVLCTGCYNPDTVATINGKEIPSGLYLYYQLKATSEAYQALNTDGSVAYDAALLDMEYEGTTVREWVKARALELCARFVYIEEEAARLGLTTNVSEDAFVDYMVSYYWSAEGSKYTSNGVAESTYRTAFVNDYQEDVIISVLFAENGELALDDAAKDAYYVENFTRIDLLTFPTAKASGVMLSAEELDEVAAVAETMLAQLNNGATFEKAYFACYGDVLTITEDESPLSADALAALMTKDNTISLFSSTFDPAMINDALAAENGSYGMYNSGSNVYLYRVTGVTADEDYASFDPYVVDGLAQEPFNARVEAAVAGYTVEVNDRAVNYYSPDNIVF